MKALVQYKPGGELIFEDIEKPKVGKGEVLVKMSFSPINPSDLSFLSGTYAEHPVYPSVAGIEGSGVVVEAGSGILPKMRMGKRVSCSKKTGKQGAWAEYMLTSGTNVVPISSQISLESAASLLVNPLTAVAFVDIAMRKKHKAIFNNAAGGALGKMLISLCKLHNIKLISTVRTESQVAALMSQGAEYVINTSDRDYKIQLANLIQKLNPTLFFDAIGGDEFLNIVEFAPKNSLVMPYANLSESNSYFNPRALLQKNIKIEGFFLGNYNHEMGIIKVLKNISIVKSLINNNLKSNIYKIVKPEQAAEAIEFYKGNMSNGKILISF
jgi:NADPH:quinone reductase